MGRIGRVGWVVGFLEGGVEKVSVSGVGKTVILISFEPESVGYDLNTPWRHNLV